MAELRPCGTEAAHRRHYNNGEEPCDACKAAHREYRRNSLRAKQLSRARQRALSRLQSAYPNTYQIFYTEELARESRAAWEVPDAR